MKGVPPHYTVFRVVLAVVVVAAVAALVVSLGAEPVRNAIADFLSGR